MPDFSGTDFVGELPRGLDYYDDLDKRDVAIESTEIVEGDTAVSCSWATTGFRHREGACVLDYLIAQNIGLDAVNLWCGGVHINHFDADHSLNVKYSDEGHPDIFQAYAKRIVNNTTVDDEVFDGLYIGSAEVVVRGFSIKKFVDENGLQNEVKTRLKNGFMFTELCAYRNITLFVFGITFDSNSKLPYFLHMTNAQNLVVGSKDHPIDPDKVSNKGIRIGGKAGAPACENIVIHAYRGLNIVLDESAEKATTIVWYEKGDDEVNNKNDFNTNVGPTTAFDPVTAFKFDDAKALARGIRNNNPLNIKVGSSKWQGLLDYDDQLDYQQYEQTFCVFADPRYGIRAAVMLLKTYQKKYSRKNIEQIIGRWASGDPTVPGYIENVSKAMGMTRKERLSVRDADTCFKLVSAMIKHENGIMPYSDDVISEGMAWAGIHIEGEAQEEVKKKVLSTEMIATAGAGGGTAAIPVINEMKEQAENIKSILPPEESGDVAVYWWANPVVLQWLEIGLLCAIGAFLLFLFWRRKEQSDIGVR